jgi:16S rRNA (adenine1518-N6/adenine1519-N6)-dimethyltransferase
MKLTKNKLIIRPKKRLGQNFLNEIGIIQKLVSTANIKTGETILEIGPGTGNLTDELLKTGNGLIAIEKDPDMIATLKEKFKESPSLELISADVRYFDETKIASPYKIVANLPFYLTAPLIRKFLESKNPPLSLAIIVQKEVAQRICSAPPKMNLLAVCVQFYATAKTIGYISKGCFWPVPKVDCAILQIVPLPRQGERADARFITEFFKIVKAGFSHPRKQLTNNLSKELKIEKKATENWLADNVIKASARAETLSINNWIMLTKTKKIDYNK